MRKLVFIVRVFIFIFNIIYVYGSGSGRVYIIPELDPNLLRVGFLKPKPAPFALQVGYLRVKQFLPFLYFILKICKEKKKNLMKNK